MHSLSDKILCLVILFAFAVSVITVVDCKKCNTGKKIDNMNNRRHTTNEKVEPSKEISGIGGSEKEPVIHTASESQKALEDRLVHGLLSYSKTGAETQQFKKDLKHVENFEGLPKEPHKTVTEKKKTSAVTEFTFCTLCNIAAKILILYRQLGGPKNLVSAALKKLCYQMESNRVCDGAIDLNIDILLYIVDNKPDITSSKICNIIGQSFNCEDENSDTWDVYLPPKVSKNPKIITTKTPKENYKPLRILHITDIHYDNKYKAGSNANCNEPLCCGVDQGEPESPEHAAGAWGDYRSCDMPLYAIENLMDTASQHDVDFIYHTGDIINHRIWETSRQVNYKSILQVIDLFRVKFPNKTVYHIAGNHEPNPLNEFAQEHIIRDDLSTHWLYDLLAEQWSTWLPRKTQKTIRKGGYYTVLVRPGFRIIALNSNVCYVYNWWLLYNDIDPYGQLQWLSDTLYQAELDDEVVHILSHVPSGDKECYKKWSHAYNKIIRRYASTIKAQFVGHTHFNELHFYYDNDMADPINVAFNGGSFTTYTDVNPNYRIYEVNQNTYEVEDYEDWIYNITEANMYGTSTPPKWYKLYSFKEAYGLRSMDLPELGKLVQSFAKNSTQLNTYFRLKVLYGDPAIKKGCNKKCIEEQLCNLVTSEFGVVDRCEKLLAEYRQAQTCLN